MISLRQSAPRKGEALAFNSINRQFKTLADFTAWLATLPPPAWHPIGSTYHNTYRPTVAQWRGLASMQSMQAGYVAKGWSSGPHCYLALGSPNPADDGVFVMTPPRDPGTHSPSCNSGAHGRFGVECVGDYNSQAPTRALQDLLVGVVAALHRYARLGPDLNAHRDCDPRTCPGDAFYALKPELQQRLAHALDSLRARTIPGPPGTPAKYCSVEAFDFYNSRGGFAWLGYAVRDEFADGGDYVFVCERTVNKRSAQFGKEFALISEAIRRGWIG